MSNARLICVTGTDGAGKTTQLVRLAERLERGRGLRVAAVTIWDPLLDPSSKQHIGFKSPAEIDRYLGTLTPISRSLFLFHAFYRALELAWKKDPQLCLLNAYWYKYYCTEVAHGGEKEKIRRLAETVFPEPDVTFCLKLTPQQAFQRKATLSGYESGFPPEKTEEAFVSFQERSHAALEELSREKGWIVLDANETPGELTEKMLAGIPT